MCAELHRVGLDDTSPQVTFFPAIRPERPGGFPSVGARGAFLSHLAVLKEARRRGFQRFLVAEDDLCLAEDFCARADRVCAGLSTQEWSIFYGGHRLERQPESVDPNGLAVLDPATQAECAHLMGFRGDAAEEIIPVFEAILGRDPGDPRGGPMHVDGAYNTYRQQRNAFTVAVIPELGHQRHSRSDVQHPRWHDRLPVIRTATALARRAANRLRVH